MTTRLPVSLRFLCLSLSLSLAIGCAGGPTLVPASPPRAEARRRSLAEALRSNGLVAIDLASAAREMSYDHGAGLEIAGDRVRVSETAGWSASSTIFARREDGTIVRVLPRVNVIVDRHVPGGCLGFAGGRAWLERVEYQLPAGARWGGDVTVSYDDHVEVVDHAATEPDGSPCPPPALD